MEHAADDAAGVGLGGVLPCKEGEINLHLICSEVKLIFAIFLVSFLNTDPPEITKKPTNQGVKVGGVASFFCAARGDPQATIVWRKNAKKVLSTF